MAKKKREHIVFDQMLKQKKNIPFSMMNKENTKKRKKKAFKGGKSLNENNSNCGCYSRRKNNYSQ